MRRQSGGRQRSGDGGGARQAGDGDPGVDGRAHQPVAGIADQWRAGVAHQANVLTGLKPLDQLSRTRFLVVVVVADGSRVDPMVPGKRRKVARVLGRDDRNALQSLASTCRKVIRVADGNGDDEERPAHAFPMRYTDPLTTRTVEAAMR